jgi:hypothetical protein
MAAAALVPAPAAVLPFIVATCICLPMIAAWEAAPSIALIQDGRRTRRLVISQLRRELDELPETHHPLGL